jgi:dTDP-4-dehydrorhamnose reductase
MTTTAIFGSTGAVGSQILATLINSENFTSIKTISRTLPQSQSPKLQTISEPSSSSWSSLIPTLSPSPTTIFNAVGTTRAKAGSIAEQWKIDHDLCIDLAKAAKEAGVKTFVFISSGGTRGFLSAYVPYSKMKVGVEEAIEKLGFENSIILRPGLIIGREVSKAPLVEMVVESLGKVARGLQDYIGMIESINV